MMLGCDRKMKRSGLDLSPSSAEMGLHKKQSKNNIVKLVLSEFNTMLVIIVSEYFFL